MYYNAAMILIIGQYSLDVVDRLKKTATPYAILMDSSRYGNTVPGGILCDFSDEAAVLAAVEALPVRPTAVISIYEKYIRIAAVINKHLGFAHAMSLETAIACTDKYIMRQRFAHAPEPISPAFAEIASEDDLRAFAAGHAFPLIFKPANLAKSLLVTRCDSLEELLAAYTQASEEAAALYARYTANLEPRFVVEEFMEGSVHSVEGFADGDGHIDIIDAIVDYEIAAEVGFEDTFHYSRNLPSRLSAEQQAAVKHVAELGMRALGMRSTPAHVEVIMTGSGPRIVEIGARNGGYRTRMHELANDVDILGAAVASYQGKRPDLTVHKRESCCVIEVFPKARGHFQAVSHYGELKALPSTVYTNVTKRPDELVGKAKEGFKACLIIILHSADAAQLAEDVEYVKKAVVIEVK